MPDGSLRPYDPSIDGYPIVVARADKVYMGPPVVEDQNGNTVLISPSGRPTDMVYPPRYEDYHPAPSYEQQQPYERPQAHRRRYERHTEPQTEHRHSHVKAMTQPEFDENGKWVDPNPVPAPGSLCDPTLEQC